MKSNLKLLIMKTLENKIYTSIFLVTMFVCSSFIIEAQKAEFGLRFMPTFTSFGLRSSSGGTVSGEVTLGYGIGALLGFNFSDNVGVQGELIYSTLNQKYKEQDVEQNIKLKYINIPLLLSLNTGKTNAVNLNIVAGPQIGISVGSKLLTSGGNGSSQAVLSVKKGDLGFAYGAGLDFGITADQLFRLGLGFRGVLGIIDISDNSGSTSTNSYYILDRTHLKTYSGYIGVSILF